MKMKSFLMIALIATATLFVACGKKETKAETAKTETAKTEKAEPAADAPAAEATATEAPTLGETIVDDVNSFIEACYNLDTDAVIAINQKMNSYSEEEINKNLSSDILQKVEQAVNYFFENASQEDIARADASLQ
jgi:hypothetical protein